MRPPEDQSQGVRHDRTENTGNHSQLPVTPWFASRRQWRSARSLESGPGRTNLPRLSSPLYPRCFSETRPAHSALLPEISPRAEFPTQETTCKPMRRTPGDLQRKATFVMVEIGCTIRQEVMTFGAPASPDAVTGLQAARAVSCGPPQVHWQRTTAPGKRATSRHPRCQAGQFLPVSLLMRSFALSSRSLSFSPNFFSSWPALSLRSLSSSPTLSLRSLSLSPALSTALPAAGATSLSFSPVLSSTSRVFSPPFSITAPVVDAAPASFEPVPVSLIFSPRLLVPDSMAPPAFSSLVPVVFTPDSICSPLHPQAVIASGKLSAIPSPICRFMVHSCKVSWMSQAVDFFVAGWPPNRPGSTGYFAPTPRL